MRELFAAMLQIIPILGLNGVLNSTGNRIVGAEDGSLYELDFTRSGTLQAASSPTGNLSLAPGLSRASVATAIR